jgi:hypothetical protein
MSFRDELNKLVERKKLEEAEHLRHKVEQEKREEAKLRSEAEIIVYDLKPILSKAANEGKTSLDVYKIERYFKTQTPLNGRNHTMVLNNEVLNKFTPFLNIKEVLIIEGILELGLDAELQYRYDGGGISSWHMIIAKW